MKRTFVVLAAITAHSALDRGNSEPFCQILVGPRGDPQTAGVLVYSCQQ